MGEPEAAAGGRDSCSRPGSAAAGAPGELGVQSDERDALQELRDQKRELVQQKKAVTKQLRNELRKRLRLRERAKKLSDEDLVRVLASREKERQAKESAKSRGVPARTRN